LYSGENRRLICLVIRSLQIGRYFTDRSGIREQRQFWALLASGQIAMRKVDGWQTLATKPSDAVIDLAA
jgi:hypothetical protein